MFLDFFDFINTVNQSLTLYFVFPAIFLLGVYFSVRLKGFQVTKLKEGFCRLFKNGAKGEGNISHFEAISTVLAGNFGTGNISGMAVALSVGGPGSLIWMWVMAFLASAVQYASCVLGVKYRQISGEGEYVGGPMYYLSKRLNMHWLARLFCYFTVFAAITVGNFAQVNSMILPIEHIGLNPFICALVLSLLVGLVILGGITRIAKLASVIVPVKAALYLAFALVVIGLNYQQILPSLKLMFEAAFDKQALLGGSLGAGALKMITTGFNRSIFATDAGTGIVPILQSGARSSNPVTDGLVTLVAPLMVMVVCTITGLVLLTTGAWQTGLESTNMVTYAFSKGLGHQIGEYIVVAALILFGFTTILAWSYCAEKCLNFLWGTKVSTFFKCFYIALVPIGTLIDVQAIWILADASITCMLLTNLIGVSALAKEVVADSLAYFKPLKLVSSTTS